MMWRGTTSLVYLKENLNKIALDVHHDDDQQSDHNYSDRRYSLSNGLHSTSEIEQYKEEIKRLQESEAQIKALSVNYAALLKEREDRISRLNDENNSLKKNFDASRSESTKMSGNSPLSKQKSRSFGKRVQNGVTSKEDASGNGIARSVQSTNKMGRSSSKSSEKELSDIPEENSRSLSTLQSKYEQQIKQLREELDKERGELASLQIMFQEEQKVNKSLQEEHNSLKADKKNMLAEMTKIRDELDRKLSEIRYLQMELNRKENAEANDVAEGLKRIVASLEKDNNDLKMGKNELKVALEVAGKSLSPNANGVHEVSVM